MTAKEVTRLMCTKRQSVMLLGKRVCVTQL